MPALTRRCSQFKLGLTQEPMNDPHQHHHHQDNKNLKLALALNLAFALIELVGGVLTGSLAILSDAMHDAGDCLSLGLGLFMEKKANQTSDAQYSYGYRRFSLVGAWINGLILAAGSVWIIQEAFSRFNNPPAPNGLGMVGLAILGIFVNGWGFLKLRRSNSLNQKMVALHLLEDLAGWMVLLPLSLVMQVWGLYFLDPLFSVLFSLFLLFQVFKNLKGTVHIFLQSSPVEVDLEAVKSQILDLDGIKGVHDLHLWSLDGQNHVFTCHLVTAPGLSEASRHQIKTQVKALALAGGIKHATLELEIVGEDCEQENCVPR